MTLSQGKRLGLHVTAVDECAFNRAWLTHKVNLFDMHREYADVMHVDEVNAHLENLGRLRDAASEAAERSQ